MSRFSGGWRTAGAGSTTLPIAGITATSGIRPHIKEIGIFNTTATAVALAVRRISALGTAGAGQTEVYENDSVQAPLATLLDTWTVAPTLVGGSIRVVTLGAAVGSGVIFTFAGDGLFVPNSTGDGIVVIPHTGTGQVCDVYFAWEE